MKLFDRANAPTCFFERDPGAALSQRCLAEAVGSALLMLVVCCSALSVHGLLSSDPASSALPGLIAGALAIAGALVALIVALGAVSGGHFNPLITILQWLSGERGLQCMIAYVLAQISGAVAGALLGASLYAVESHAAAPLPAAAGALVLSELVATFGLLLIVAGAARGGKAETGPFAVGGWIAAGIVATPSRCYANPALTIAATVATGPAALAPSTAAVYVAAQALAMLIAFAAASILYPARQ